MLSPSQVERLEESLDRYRTMLVAGLLFFVAGVPFLMFGSQDPANGTQFMLLLMGLDETIALILIVVGWVMVRSIERELRRHEPAQARSQAAAA